MSIPPAASSTWHTILPSTLGDLTMVRDQRGLRGLYFPHHWYRPDPATFGPRRDQGFEEAARQLTGYLAGVRRDFDLPLVLPGDDVQRAVWALVAQVPYGETITYGELAAQLGGSFPAITAQQVGAAVGRNPLCIIVPCHRVLGRNGKLTGYAGGIGRKRRLLELEREQAPESVTMGPHEYLRRGVYHT